MTLAVATAVAGSRTKGHLVDATDLTWFQQATSTEADSEWETMEALHGIASMSIDSFMTPVGLKEMSARSFRVQETKVLPVQSWNEPPN